MANEIQKRAQIGLNIYALLVRSSDLKIWDGNSFETAPAWADRAIELTESANISGLYSANLPVGVAVGSYSLHFYMRDGATAAETDTFLDGAEFIIRSTHANIQLINGISIPLRRI